VVVVIIEKHDNMPCVTMKIDSLYTDRIPAATDSWIMGHTVTNPLGGFPLKLSLIQDEIQKFWYDCTTKVAEHGFLAIKKKYIYKMLVNNNALAFKAISSRKLLFRPC
jgi:hypothetical protein